MNFLRFNLKWWATVMVAAGSTTCHAQSQASDDSILSQPTDVLSPATGSTLDLPSGSGAAPSFNYSGSSLPMPPPVYQNKNNNHNWALMTPDQIMGLQTPQQIYGLPSPDQGMSPEQMFVKRQQDKANSANANGMAGADGIFSNQGNKTDLLGHPNSSDPFSPNYRPDGSENSDNSSGFSHIFGASSSSSVFGNKAKPTQLGSPTKSYAEEKKQKLEDAAEMARFRTLIGEVPPPSSKTTSPVSAEDPTAPSLQPLANFDPLSHSLISHPSDISDISKPTGLTPLPQLSASTYTPPKKTKRPTWQAQPPPWLSDGIAPPTTPPVRKFY